MPMKKSSSWFVFFLRIFTISKNDYDERRDNIINYAADITYILPDLSSASSSTFSLLWPSSF